MAVKPLTPEQGLEVKPKIPDFVIEAVNEILVEKLYKGSCTFTQDELMELVLKKTTMSRQKIYENHYFDFEDTYREMGWKVTYDKPAYYETYKANFTFTAKGK